MRPFGKQKHFDAAKMKKKKKAHIFLFVFFSITK